jgi:hypothetical protein
VVLSIWALVAAIYYLATGSVPVNWIGYI